MRALRPNEVWKRILYLAGKNSLGEIREDLSPLNTEVNI